MKEPAYEKIGIVDTEWIVHQSIPSLGSQGKEEDGISPGQGVREAWSCLFSRTCQASN